MRKEVSDFLTNGFWEGTSCIKDSSKCLTDDEIEIIYDCLKKHRDEAHETSSDKKSLMDYLWTSRIGRINLLKKFAVLKNKGIDICSTDTIWDLNGFMSVLFLDVHYAVLDEQKKGKGLQKCRSFFFEIYLCFPGLLNKNLIKFSWTYFYPDDIIHLDFWMMK